MPSPLRILIVRLSHLGDVVHALPLFHALRARFPAAEIAWAIQPEFAELVEGLPGLARSFYFGRRDGIKAWTKLAAELDAWRPDWTIDAQGNTKSAVVTLVSRAPRRTGLARGDWTEGFGAHVLTETAAPARGPHAVERTTALVRHTVPGNDPLSFDLGLAPAERARGRADFAGRCGAPSTILVPGDARDIRSWPAASFAALGRGLAGAGERVLVLSGPAEADVGEFLERELADEGIAHWVGQRGLRTLAALFSVAAERGARAVVCDSGPAHLAAAAGLPVHLLAGPQAAARTGPWPMDARSPHRVIARADPPPCQPCLARDCSHAEGPICLTGLAPSDVLHRLVTNSTPFVR